MNTQKRNQMIALAAAIILGICAALGTLLTGNKPYAGLESEQLSKEEMQLTPPDVRVEVEAEEVEQLTPILRQLTIYRQDDSYTDYAGQTVQVTLTLQDGSTIQGVRVQEEKGLRGAVLDAVIASYNKTKEMGTG